MATYVTREHKINILDWLVNIITDPYVSNASKLERQLCIDNDSPDGFMFKHMTFNWSNLSNTYTCKPELEERAKEVWELNQKIKVDSAYLTNYLKKVFARLTEFGQLYPYVPQFMHKKLDEIFERVDIGEKKLIPGLEPDEAMFKLISFYVMSRLII